MKAKLPLCLALIFCVVTGIMIAEVDHYNYPVKAQRISFSDDTRIKSVLYKLEQSIKTNNESMFLDLLHNNFEDSTGSIIQKNDRKNLFEESIKISDLRYRSNYSIRRLNKWKTPLPNSDFRLIINNIKYKNQNKKADVDYTYYFVYDQPDDDPKKGIYRKKQKQYTGKITLAKEGDDWEIAKFNKFFGNLKNRKDKLKNDNGYRF